MRKYILSVIIVLVILPLMTDQLLAARKAKIVFRKGVVQIKKKGHSKWVAFNPRISLQENDYVKTGPKSKVEIRFDDGSRMQVFSNSTAILKTYSKSKKGRNSNIAIQKGSAYTKVNKLRKNSSFRVSSVSGVAGVRGTEFYVSVDDSEKMNIEVYEGSVNVKSSKTDENTVVNAGYSSSVNDKGFVEKNKKIKKRRNLEWVE